MNKLKRRTGLIFFALMAILFLSACTNQKQGGSDGKIKVVSSVDFYGEAAKAILGNHGTVTSIIKSSSVDAEDYEPQVSDAKLVADADVVLYNGLGYDQWMNKLASANDKAKNETINVGTQVMNLKSGANPHIWYDSETMPKLAKRLTTVFSKKDPAHQKAYQRNLKTYLKKLESLQSQLDQIKENRDLKQVAVSEPVFNYQLESMGYKVIDPHFAEAIEEGSDPSPKDIRELRNAITKNQIAFFVENTQNTSDEVKSLAKLAKQSGVPVVKVTETMPPHEDYVEWMEKQNQQVEKIQEMATND